MASSKAHKRATVALGNATFPYPISYSDTIPQAGGQPWPDTAIQQGLLLQRDLAMTIPINRIAYPFINLTSAHFVTSFTNVNVTNVGNLLNFGFRRFGLNLYWNALQATFQICPVDVSGLGGDPSMPVTFQGLTCMPNDPGLDGILRQFRTWLDNTNSYDTQFDFVQLVLTLQNLDISREVQSIPPPSITSSSSASASLSASSALSSASLASQISSSLSSLSSTSSSTLPSARSTSGVIASSVSNNVGTYVMSPPLLQRWRSDLNASFGLSGMAYFDAQVNSTGYYSTTDGWPNPYFLFHSAGRRILVACDPTVAEFNQTASQLNTSTLPISLGIGTNATAIQSNVQVTLYDIISDLNTVFPPEDLALYPVSTSSATPNASIYSLSNAAGFADCEMPVSGIVLNGTGIEGPDETGAKAIVESWSWVTVEDSTSEIWNYTILSQAAVCGYSIGVNEAFPNLSVYDQVESGPTSLSLSGYSNPPLTPFDIIAGTIWSWDQGQPIAASSSQQNAAVEGASQNYQTQCAAMQVSDGKWLATDCNAAYRVACRLQGNVSLETTGLPDAWTLGDKSSFFGATSACSALQGNLTSTFSVPFIAKENAALYQKAANLGLGSNDKVWLSVNSIAVQDCWAIGGPDVDCPYAVRTVRSTGTIVLVSLVAGIIVLLFAVFFLYSRIKRWIGNRQERRRRERAMNRMVHAGDGRGPRSAFFGGGSDRNGMSTTPIGYRPIRPDDKGEWEGIAA